MDTSTIDLAIAHDGTRRPHRPRDDGARRVDPPDLPASRPDLQLSPRPTAAQPQQVRMPNAVSFEGTPGAGASLTSSVPVLT